MEKLWKFNSKSLSLSFYHSMIFCCFVGKHKKGNNYIDSNDIADGDTENTSKRKGMNK